MERALDEIGDAGDGPPALVAPAGPGGDERQEGEDRHGRGSPRRPPLSARPVERVHLF